MNQPFTVAEFRDRIAAILRVPGEPPVFRNSVPSLLKRNPKHLTPSEKLMQQQKRKEK